MVVSNTATTTIKDLSSRLGSSYFPIKEEDLRKIQPGGVIYELMSHKVTLEVVSGPNRTGSYHPQCIKSISW